LIRSSGSVGAKYAEASDDLGKANEKMKIKISRREAKESVYWLGLVLVYEDANMELLRDILIDEATLIRGIISAILLKL
jgi:four helix bundle protein